MAGASAIKVLSTVVNEVRDWIQKAQPDAVYFLAKRNNGKFALYQKMLKYVGSEIKAMGYHARTYKGSTDLGDVLELVKDKNRPKQRAAKGKANYVGEARKMQLGEARLDHEINCWISEDGRVYPCVFHEAEARQWIDLELDHEPDGANYSYSVAAMDRGWIRVAASPSEFGADVQYAQKPALTALKKLIARMDEADAYYLDGEKFLNKRMALAGVNRLIAGS